MSNKPKIFIDGDQGTTGLQIRERLGGRDDLDIIRLADEVRKDVSARRAALNEADVAILCLPDDAAREAVALVDNPETRVIDASSAHRVAPDWVYGFPEFLPGQADKIANAKRVSNPGCYPTGAVGLVRPLVDAGLVASDFPISVHAVSGYSGGGKSMIAAFEEADHAEPILDPVRAYGLRLDHKHVGEMQVHMGLEHRPIFAPSVGKYYKGMLVFVPLPLWALPGSPSLVQVYEALAERYLGCEYVRVQSLQDVQAIATLSPEGVNDTNTMNLYVFGNENEGQVLLAAQLDNLGKGASGAAVQSLDLMLDKF